MKDGYFSLSKIKVDSLRGGEAVEVLAEVVAERATVTGGGTILRWSEFNENPDPLVNELLARVLVEKVALELVSSLQWREVVIFAIENSATYLSTALAYELAEKMSLERPVRIVRARKIGAGSTISPAMGEEQYVAQVKPITAGGKTRRLVASISDREFFSKVKQVLVVDDFKATGSTLRGGVQLAREMFGEEVGVVALAALGKPEQETEGGVGEERASVETALDVSFGPGEDGKVWLEVNGVIRLPLAKAKVSDFIND